MDYEKKIEKLKNPFAKGNEGCVVSMIDILEKVNEIITVLNGEAELTESEDERIRKKLIRLVQDAINKTGTCYTEEEGKSLLAYLEEQKEQKPNIELIQRSWYLEGYHDREFGKEPKWIIKAGEGGPKYEENPKYGQMLKEQKSVILGPDETEFPYNHPANTLEGEIKNIWSKLSRENAFVASFEGFRKVILHFVNFVQKIQKPVETQDYSGLTDLERAIHRGFLCAGMENIPITIIKETSQDCLAQMKPAEWSEEDANLLNRTLSIIRWASDSDRTNRIIGDEGAIELEDWLKSLRPSWKPSEKQMVALKNTMYDYKDAPYFQDLKYLYDDLKKL